MDSLPNPVGARILILVDLPSERTAGGIVLPEKFRKLNRYQEIGTVIKTGNAPEIEVGIGDKVIYFPGDNPKFAYRGQPYRIVKNEHLWCKIEESAHDQ